MSSTKVSSYETVWLGPAVLAPLLILVLMASVLSLLRSLTRSPRSGLVRADRSAPLVALAMSALSLLLLAPVLLPRRMRIGLPAARLCSLEEIFHPKSARFDRGLILDTPLADAALRERLRAELPLPPALLAALEARQGLRGFDALSAERRPRQDEAFPPVAIGGGWSFFLARERPRDGALLLDTRAFRGLVEGPKDSTPERWRAGTTIGELQASLTKRGRTVASHPSVLSTTLGGWIAGGAHGGGGTLWTSCFGEATLLHWPTGRVFRAKPSDVFKGSRVERLDPPEGISSGSNVSSRDPTAKRTTRRGGNGQDADFLILDVDVLSVEDVVCFKEVFRLPETARDAIAAKVEQHPKKDVLDEAREAGRDEYAAFLETPSHLRMIQLGARGALCLLWRPRPEGEERAHQDPHFFSREGLWLQSDVASIFQGLSSDAGWFDWPIEPRKNWPSQVRLSAANDYTPPPPFWLTPIGLCVTNFELFVYARLDARSLRLLCLGLLDVLRRSAEHGLVGRVELRYGQSGKIFLDCVVLRGAPLAPLLRRIDALVQSLFGTETRVERHKGKHHAV